MITLNKYANNFSEKDYKDKIESEFKYLSILTNKSKVQSFLKALDKKFPNLFVNYAIDLSQDKQPVILLKYNEDAVVVSNFEDKNVTYELQELASRTFAFKRINILPWSDSSNRTNNLVFNVTVRFER